jgi:hypothetical protein
VERLKGQAIEDVLPDTSREQAQDQLREAIRAGEPLRFQDVRYGPQGVRHFESLVIPFHANGAAFPAWRS